jgi:monoamine oxidase
MNKSDVVIIGAGLTGLALAYFLRDISLSIRIIDARDRIGGRILTTTTPSGHKLEMGATWLGKKHRDLNALLKELGIDTYIQNLGTTAIYEPISTSPPQIVDLPPNNDPSYRITGGTTQLIHELHQRLSDNTTISLSDVVSSVHIDSDVVNVNHKSGPTSAKIVVSTLPPYLLAHTIDIQPSLSGEIHSLLDQTQTWMGESIKVGFTYEEPFWRAGNLSGTIMSNVGPIPEMYEHTDHENKHHSLKGFLNGVYHSLTKAERMELCLAQLEKYYGSVVRSYLSYEELVWRNEPYTFSSYHEHMLPHQNNGHEQYRSTIYNDQFIIAGAETASAHPGYMDGAVCSALEIADRILTHKLLT